MCISTVDIYIVMYILYTNFMGKFVHDTPCTLVTINYVVTLIIM